MMIDLEIVVMWCFCSLFATTAIHTWMALYERYDMSSNEGTGKMWENIFGFIDASYNFSDRIKRIACVNIIMMSELKEEGDLTLNQYLLEELETDFDNVTYDTLKNNTNAIHSHHTSVWNEITVYGYYSIFSIPLNKLKSSVFKLHVWRDFNVSVHKHAVNLFMHA